MSSERTKIGIIFGVVALAVGGGAFYFFKIYQPHHALSGAQDEIVAWEARWSAARQCLLGSAPASSRTSEALAIHELSPDPWDRGSCTPLVGKLVRGFGDDTGIKAVELAWLGLDRSATAAAAAFADHISGTTLRVDRLPAALDELDAARVELRAAAELPSESTAGTALPAAQLIAISDGGDPITKLDLDNREVRELTSAHGLVSFGHTASHAVQLMLIAGGTPVVGRIGPSSRRAAGDPAWGATVLPGDDLADGEVDIGAFDVEGAMAKPATAAFAPRPAKYVFTGELRLAAVAGHLADGAVAFKTARKLAVAHVAAGIPTVEPVLAIDEESAAGFADLDGRAVLAWRVGDKQQVRWLAPAGAALPADVRIDEACFSADRAWLHGGGRIASLHDQTLLVMTADRTLVGCSPDGAITRGEATHYTVCTDHCRAATLAGAPPDAAVTTLGGKLVAIAAHEGVVGVWREDQKPRFFALAQPVHAITARGGLMALTDGKVIDLVATGAGGAAVLVRVPAN